MSLKCFENSWQFKLLLPTKLTHLLPTENLKSVNHSLPSKPFQPSQPSAHKAVQSSLLIRLTIITRNTGSVPEERSNIR